MKAPNFINIRLGYYYGEGKTLDSLKPGDKVILSFGKYRERDTKYKVETCRHNKKKELLGISLTRG